MKIIKYLSEILFLLDKKTILHLPLEKIYLKFEYRINMHKKLNLKNPQTFNEKLQWLKLYDRKEIYTNMVDKYEAKRYVSNILGEEYIIPTIGIYDKFDDIEFDKLPNQFIIKCTHDSGGIVIVKDIDKLDIKSAKKKINNSLKRNFYYYGLEWPYKNVRPRIIIEKYMSNGNEDGLRDYKFFTFNGKVRCFKIDFNRFVKHQANYYDINTKLLKFGEKIYPPDFEKKLDMPKNLKKMIELAEKLSNKNPFVRVDFYEVDNKIYFGEITFYPASGFGEFIPEEWDRIMGDWLNLPDKNQI